MKKIFIPIYLVCAGLIFFTFQAFKTNLLPPDNLPGFLNKANLLNVRFPQEKIYLHFDRPSYMANDNVWFKAYLLNSPITECNLYVELINPSGTIIQKNTIWALDGLAYGDFRLSDTLSSGIYQVRAYTNWMRNFDDWWFFRKDLLIWNLGDKEYKSPQAILNSRDVDLRFFPEGGSFVENLNNRVAFKAADKNGKGLDVEGDIFDNQGNTVISFKSLRNGMGSFEFTPKEGVKYKAKVNVSGGVQKVADLPEARHEGVIMRIASNENQLRFSITEQPVSNAGNASAGYYLVGLSRGTIFYQKEISMENGIFNFALNKSKMQSGIVQFTLFGKDMIPLCERLVFIKNNDFITVEIKPDKPDYKPRENVQITLNSTTAEDTPCLANLSVSVINSNASLKAEDYPNNILTQFLLNSELKGNIEEPAFYFKDDSISTLTALDNLMLTHGYRYFDWEEIREDKTPEILYPAEESMQVSGTVKSLLLNKPVPDCKVTLMTLNKMLSVYEQKSDSSGRFLFSKLYFYDTLGISLQTINPNGKRNSYIELDNKSYISPEGSYLPDFYQYKTEIPILTSTDFLDIRTDLIKKKWRLSDTILLGDITVVASKSKKEDGHFRTYNEADYVYDMEKQEYVSSNIFESIQGRMPGIRWEEEFEQFVFRGKPVLLFLDGLQADYDLLSTFPSQAFDKVELMKMAIFAGVNYEGAVLFFYTKRGAMFENQKTDAVGMKSTKIVGYSVIRKFYAPEYKDANKRVEKRDYRLTLYWNPFVQTNENGEAHVSFYNSDDSGNMQVIVEGVTGDGKLCRGTGSYSVTY